MKADLINFELWFTDSEERIQDDINRATVYYALKDIEAAIKTKNIDTVVGMLFMDGFLYRDNSEFYNVLKQIETGSKSLGIKKLFMIVGTCNGYQKELDKRNIDIEIVDWNFGANQAWQYYHPLNDRVLEWDPSSEKFMFPTGMPSRPNRIGLIKRLHEHNLLHTKGIWSFYPPWTDHDKEWCRNYCADYSNDQYDHFLKQCKNKIDNRYAEAKTYTTKTGKKLKEENIFQFELIETGGGIDPTNFKNSLISLISEGPEHNDQYNFFTEKLWRTVYNNQPFILVESNRRIEYAKSLGLRTFEKYTNFYVDGLNEEQRLDKAVEALVYFFKNYQTYQEEIKEDIWHNKQVINECYKKTQTLIGWLEKDLNIDKETVDYYLQTCKSSRLIRIPEGVE